VGFSRVGTGLAFIYLPKRSVTAIGIKNGYKQDSDARRTTTITIRRSRTNNNNILYP
jgi:hypothetical protein